MNVLVLENINLNDKGYNDIIERATSLIPIISKDWTDYNNSDPGITILQTLAVLKWAQQSYVNTINSKVRSNLLKLIGYTQEPVMAPCAVATVKTPQEQEIRKNTKFYAVSAHKDSLVYETREDFYVVNNQIQNVISVSDDKSYDMTMIVTNGSANNFAKIFTPDSFRQELYISFKNPLPLETFVSVYFDLELEAEGDGDFNEARPCDIVWEYYADGGWRNLCVQDQTYSFAKSGYLRIKAAKEMQKLKTADLPEGFYIRARVVDGSFDVMPKLKRIVLNAIELFGQDTKAKSICARSDGTSEQVIVINSELAKNKNMLVLAKEGDEYVEYRLFEGNMAPQTGHYYTVSEQAGRICIEFSKQKFGFAPEANSEIKIIVYSNNFNSAFVGRVYGYDEQRIEYNFSDIMEQNLEFMLRLDEKEGRFVECVAASDFGEEGDLEYSLDYENNVIIINNNVNYSGDLFITSCTMCKGRQGNIKANRKFKLDELGLSEYGEITVQNIEDVQNGKDREAFDDTLKRAAWDMESLCVTVTEKDYVKLLSKVPGLIIEKMNVITSYNDGLKIAVKVKSDKKLPELTSRHIEMLTNHIEKYRPIATKVSFLSPKYVPIDISLRIIAQQGFKDVEKIIYNELKREVDGVNGEAEFGKGVFYGELYSKLENLECVKQIESLEFFSSSEYAHKDSKDNLILAEFALGYLNRFDIEINNMMMVI